eukprot:gene6122-6741_t
MTLTPTPINEIIPQNNNPSSSSSSVNYDYDPATGQLHLYLGPDCTETIFMLPFPFLCMGCCLSATCDWVFQEREQQVVIRYAWGHLYLLPCLRSVHRYSYQDIANVGYYCCHARVNGVLQYRPVVLMKDGQYFPFAAKDNERGLRQHVLAMHFFLFGRGNADYRPPAYETLKIN